MTVFSARNQHVGVLCHSKSTRYTHNARKQYPENTRSRVVTAKNIKLFTQSQTVD